MKKLKLTDEAFLPLDDEEKEFMEQEEQYVSIPRDEFKKMKSLLEKAAKRSIASRKMISIKVRVEDIDLFKAEAEQKGIPYQTLMNSVLHQYAVNRIKPSTT